ncbi:MAG TPA: hypothetical protein VIT67_23555 [Povalibacter sp.]
MKTSTTVRLTAMCVAALTLPAWAGGDHGYGDKMAMMDTDGDGKITATEHATGAKTMFGKMDANGDGRVTATEMEAKHSGKSAAEKIAKIDSDGDGVLTAAEHAAGAKTMFTKMDADGDGTLSEAECSAGHKKEMKDHE